MGDEPSSPDLGDGQTPYDRSARGEISEEEYNRLQGEHIDRVKALQQAFEKIAVEAAQDFLRKQAAEKTAFYDDEKGLDPWDLAESLTNIIRRTVSDEGVLDWISEVAAIYARHASIRPDGLVYVLEAGPYYKIGRTSTLTTRIKTLNIQLPFPVRCIAAFPSEEMSKAEAELHKRFERTGLTANGSRYPTENPGWSG